MLQKQEVEKQFEKHIKEHEGLIYKICRVYAYNNEDRQDLFQEIVIQLWKTFPNFKGQSKFSTWLYRVGINTAITGLRKQKNFIDSYEPATLPNRPEEYSTAEEQWQLLYEAIGRLNDVEKALIMLYMEDKTYAEMEDILGIGQGALRVKMNRIKDKLRQLTKSI